MKIGYFFKMQSQDINDVIYFDDIGDINNIDILGRWYLAQKACLHEFEKNKKWPWNTDSEWITLVVDGVEIDTWIVSIHLQKRFHVTISPEPDPNAARVPYRIEFDGSM